MFDDFYDFNMFAGGYFNDQECKVIDLCNDYKYCSVSGKELTNEIYRRGIDYDVLPERLSQKIDDEIDCY